MTWNDNISLNESNAKSFFYIGALATFPTLEEETCSAESCGSTFRKFAKVSNARSHELINNDLSDGGEHFFHFKCQLSADD